MPFWTVALGYEEGLVCVYLVCELLKSMKFGRKEN